MPTLEATLVEEPPVYDAIAIQSDANQGESGAQENTWWKQNQKYLLVGLIALVIGGLIATVATLVGSKDDINIVVPDLLQSTSSTAPSVVSSDGSIDKTMQSMPSTTSPSETDNLRYYADRENNQCNEDLSGPDDSTVQQQMRWFQSLDECCELA